MKTIIILLLLCTNITAAGLTGTEHFSVLCPNINNEADTNNYAKLVCNNAERYANEFALEWYNQKLPRDCPRGLIRVRFDKTNEGFMVAGPKYHNIFLISNIKDAPNELLKHEIFHYVSACIHPEPNRVPIDLEERCAKVYNYPYLTDTPSVLKRELNLWRSK